jgi:ceramide glucosyltransferase
VTILIPLCGDEPGLGRRIAMLHRQDYGGPVQILCGVQDPLDPVIPVVRRAMAELPGADIGLHIDPRVAGSNRKVANLANLIPLARHQALILLDSDIEVGPGYLATVIGALNRPGVGAVTCLYHGVATDDLCARLAAMSINLHFLPAVCLGLRFHLCRPCFGSTIALRRETLDRIGGLEAFRDDLMDDYAIGEAVRGDGKQVLVLPLCLGHLCRGASFREFFATQLRYARTIRSIDPIGSAGAIVTHPFPLALMAALLGADSAGSIALLAIACRLALCMAVEHRFKLQHRHAYWLAPLHGLILFAVFVAGFFGNTVVWRGFRTPVGRSGRRSGIASASWMRRIRDGLALLSHREGH